MSLKFSFPEHPFNSTSMTLLIGTSSTTNSIKNMVKGDRAQIFNYSSSAVYFFCTFLTSGTVTADHWIAGRADLAVASGATRIGLWGKYGSGPTDTMPVRYITSFSYNDLRSQDIIQTFSSASSSYGWVFYMDGVTGNYPISKIYFGNLFTLDQNPTTWELTFEEQATEPFITDSGHTIIKQSDYPKRTWRATWVGITDAKLFEFITKCQPFLVDDRKIGLFLYDDSGLNEFFGASLQHVWMHDIETTRYYNDYNIISCYFTEQVG